MTDRELMQQALDVIEAAIKAGDWKVDGACDPDYVLEAIRTRLAQPEPEPVAQVNYNERQNIAWLFGKQLPDGTLLYTSQPQREWQGLTDETEIKHCWYEACQTDLELTSQLVVYFARAIEAKLREKNGNF